MHGAFDPEGQRAAGYPVVALELLLLLLVEAVIVVTTPAIGVMLGMSLIIGPAATARLWTDRIRWTVPLATALGVGACLIGLELSIRWDMAAGGTITLVTAALFLASLAVSPHGIRTRCSAAPKKSPRLRPRRLIRIRSRRRNRHDDARALPLR